MKALAIDTSNLVMGIAVVDGDKVLGEVITYLNKNHSVRVMPAIEALMEEVGVKPNEVERIIVASGPGSYTGVRIGVTIAKTLAWSLNIPLVGVSSLEVLARNGAFFSGVVSPLFDARRGQVYTGLYGAVDGVFQCHIADQNVLLVTWLESLKQQNEAVLFVGNDVALHKQIILDVLGEQAFFAPMSLNNPRPSELARIGLEKEPEPSVHAFVPNYVRLAEAEVNWLAAQQKKG